ncbi:MAG: hypothetical protein C0614_14285, partial [Desulfuromonas sp.]
MQEFNFPPSRQARTLLKVGLLLIPIAYVSDCALDAVLFGEESFWQQLISPSLHEVAIRVLFSIFILAATLLGVHFLSLGSEREYKLEKRVEALEREKIAINDINHTLT